MKRHNSSQANIWCRVSPVFAASVGKGAIRDFRVFQDDLRQNQWLLPHSNYRAMDSRLLCSHYLSLSDSMSHSDTSRRAPVRTSLAAHVSPASRSHTQGYSAHRDMLKSSHLPSSFTSSMSRRGDCFLYLNISTDGQAGRIHKCF